MRLLLSLLLRRLRSSPLPVALRLLGLTAAVVLAAALPTFIAASTDRLLQSEIARSDDALELILSWSPGAASDHGNEIRALDAYLHDRFAPQAALAGLESLRFEASDVSLVQRVGLDGRLLASRRWLQLAPLVRGLELVQGRLPASGDLEVVVLESLLVRAGYAIGDRLRVPLPQSGAGSPASIDVTIVGTVRLAPVEGILLQGIGSTLEGALFIHDGTWSGLGLQPGEAIWSIRLPAASIRGATLAQTVKALRELPLRAERILPGVSVTTTPLTWLSGFLDQMQETHRFLLVLLAPVFLLVLLLVTATAQMMADARRTEVAALRSRGMTPWRVVLHYSLESASLAGGSLLLGLALSVPAVDLMGLFAGFLQLVNRPLPPAELSVAAVLWGALAALIGEGIAAIPLVRLTRLTVVTFRQEDAVRPVAVRVATTFGEALLVAATLYAAWSVWTAQTRVELTDAAARPDLVHLALPALLPLAAGVFLPRLLAAAARLTERVAGNRIGAVGYLVISLLRSPVGRQRTLGVMLALTAGLGVYGIVFSGTLDRDLVAGTTYRIGADLMARPFWEVDETATGGFEDPEYREPPYSAFTGLPGVASIARVQSRSGVSLYAGNRSLGQVTAMGISPQEFYDTAKFLPRLLPAPPAVYLNLLAGDERAAILSWNMATRFGIQPGDVIRLVQEGFEVALQVVAVVPNWPGRLPEDGDFVVAHLPYLQDELGLRPYDVWLRLDEGAAWDEIQAALRAREVPLLAARDSRAEIALARRNPFRLGVYSSLSVGFVTSLIAMGLTHLLGTDLLLRRRAKEYGVLRAMGLTRRKLALATLAEQCIATSVACAAGLGAGAIAAALCVPLLRWYGNPHMPLPVTMQAGDFVGLVTWMLLAIAAGMAVVAVWLRRLRVTKALRLGEDA